MLEPGRLAPSLQPADASEQRRLTREGQPSPRAATWAHKLKACLVSDVAGGSVWQWQAAGTATKKCEAVGREARRRGDPIVALYAPWPRAETPHAPGAPTATRRLYRGLTTQEAAGDSSRAGRGDG